MYITESRLLENKITSRKQLLLMMKRRLIRLIRSVNVRRKTKRSKREKNEKKERKKKTRIKGSSIVASN